MSDVGYQSSMQNALKINYNNLDEFINAIIKGIKTPVKRFEDIGLLDERGMPQQISTGILQIENELYDIVRPKDLVQAVLDQQVFKKSRNRIFRIERN